LDTVKYDTTCPFVEKVWNRAASLGDEDYTVVIHGKANHEETRATFSHSASNGKSLIVRNLEETKFLAEAILGKVAEMEFYEFFTGRHSDGFDFKSDLIKVGVVNQTTMLASETEAIADYLKETMMKKYGAEKLNLHFADTRDTLCYATNDNQKATAGLLKTDSDLSIVVGGYNSSNTTHIVELLEEKFPVYFIASENEIISENEIEHFDIREKKNLRTKNFLPTGKEVNIALTSGASCPDSVVDRVMLKLLSYFETDKTPEEALEAAFKKE
ncbi:MAG: 4-hydroxy-3-methylbut-2-enyl diphosphate reductase, partial [Chlorobi bacterium]|nr:4-hydroxy-3-methylbut-2-enyl diphosphate reductase [Chlorobiota bacterium]